MPHQMYAVSLRWIKTPMNAALIDNTLGQMGDWLRFNSNFWLVWSGHDVTLIGDRLKGVLTSDDSVLVMLANPTSYQGWAPPWVWEWIADKQGKLYRGES